MITFLSKMQNRLRGRWKQLAHALEAFTMLMVVFGGGYVTGNWVGTEDQRVVTRERIDELTQAHAMALDALTRNTVRAATATQSAATAVEAAASVATQAAKVAGQAAAKVGTTKPTPAPPPAVSNATINRNVEQANERLKKP